MKATFKKAQSLRGALQIAVGVAALHVGAAFAADIEVTLTGAEEAPPVQTAAKGTGTISIAEDKSVSGSIKTTGVDAVAAHIHVAPPGKNGPPVIPLEKTSENEWSVPEGSKLTDEQYASFKQGDLYVNVHSPDHKSGEIRGQLEP